MAKINPKSRTTPRPKVAKRTAIASPVPTVEAATEIAASTAQKLSKAVTAGRGMMKKSTDPAGMVSELNNIDFKKMIGAPLQACVDAQVQSSLATVSFINSVGFITNDMGKKELVMVDFTHERVDVKDDGTPMNKKIYVKVPLLAMLPIPSLRIEHVTIDFNAKLNSVETSSVSDELGIKAELAVGWGPISLKVSASYQRKSVTGVEVKKEYALNVNVKAVQDEMPAGLEKILGMLSA